MNILIMRKKFEEVFYDNVNVFMLNVMIFVFNDSYFVDSELMFIMSGVLIVVILNFGLDKNFGYVYLVFFNSKNK